jgi:hypothetical protein
MVRHHGKNLLTLQARRRERRPVPAGESGTEHLNVRVPATNILPNPEMEPFKFSGQFKPGTQISLQKNPSCLSWLNLVDLVSLQDMEVLDRMGEDTTDSFLNAMAGVKETLSTARMMDDDGCSPPSLMAVELNCSCRACFAQELPFSLFHFSPRMTWQLSSWPSSWWKLTALLGSRGRSLSLTSSSSQGEEATLLRNNPAVAHTYCQMLVSRIIVPEELTSLECMGYSQGPRQGKGESPYVREWVAPRAEQPAKKLRAGQPGQGARQQAGTAGHVCDSQGITQLKIFCRC